jgi:hypothetical protein
MGETAMVESICGVREAAKGSQRRTCLHARYHFSFGKKKKTHRKTNVVAANFMFLLPPFVIFSRAIE